MILFALQVALVIMISSAALCSSYVLWGAVERYVEEKRRLSIARTQAECEQLEAACEENVLEAKARVRALKAAAKEVESEFERG